MPRVRILAGIAGENRSPGEVLDLPANEADALIKQQRAELVRSSPIETPEGVRLERATTRRAPVKKRG
jgi:hypothetical protein